MENKRAWAEINLAAIGRNMAFIRQKVPPPVKILATVKANAYGHGAVEVSKTVLENGADFLGVAIAEEGAQLRENQINAPILIFGYTPEPLLDQVLRYDLTQTVFSMETAAALSRIAIRRGKRAQVHIKVDTGMNRLGFLPSEQSLREIREIVKLPGIQATGIYTHFAQADAPAESFTRDQLTLFLAFVQALEAKGVHIPLRHAANSAGLLTGPRYQLDMVRAGIIVYGLKPSDAFTEIPLEPAMSLKARVSLVKSISAGESVGYGRTFFTQRETRIATIPVGYADGFPRRMAKGGRVLIGGRSADIIGRVCMDQFMVDITEYPFVKAGDEVVLMGRQGGAEITADEIARVQDTISYEVVCGISNRVPRVYRMEIGC